MFSLLAYLIEAYLILLNAGGSFHNAWPVLAECQRTFRVGHQRRERAAIRESES